MAANLDLDATLRSAYDAFERSDWTSVDAACAAIIAGAPERTEGWQLLSRLRLVRNDPVGATATLDEGLRRARDTLPLMEDLAELCIRRGDARRALDLAAELRRRGGDLVKFVNLSARAHWRLGDHDLALVDFALAARHAPDVAPIQVGYAKALVQLAREAEAVSVLRAFLALHPDGTASALLAHCEYDAAQPAAVLPMLDTALAATPADPSLRLTGAMLRTMAGDAAGGQRLLGDLLRDDRHAARWESFIALRDAGCARFVGLPIEVLADGLRAATSSGHVAEFGVGTGRTLRLIAAYVRDAVHGFDAFEDGRRLADLPAHVVLHAGRFAATLPAFAPDAGPARFWHIDTDQPDSTRDVLHALDGTLQVGSVIVFDDLVGYPGWTARDHAVWLQHARARGLEFAYLSAALGEREVAVQIVRL